MRDAIALIGLLANTNVQAFLRVIRAGEGTADDDGYRVMFGGAHIAGLDGIPGTFDDFADHPRKAITRSMQGKTYTSTAAGAYQFLARTWDGLVRQYGFANFEPRTQDIAALALIDGRKALDDVIAGRFEAAVRKCNREWASLPGSPYGQPTRTMAQAHAAYLQAGGALAPAVETITVAADGSAEPTTPAPPPKEPPMLPFVAAGITALIQAAPALIRVFGDSPRAEKNAQAAEVVADLAKQVTGESTVEGAVHAIQADPAQAAAFREQVHLSMNELVGLAERIVAMERIDIQAARQYNAEEPLFLDFGWLRMKFIHFLSIGFVAFSGAFVWQFFAQLTPELKGAVITLMVIAGYVGVKDYWMSSSAGSALKNEMLKNRGSAPPAP